MKYFHLLLVSILITACRQAGTSSKTALSSASADTATWVTFTGTLPCADCSGVVTSLTLHMQQEEPDFQFRMKEIYQGLKSGRDETLTSEGTYSILRGNAANPDATIIQLNPDKDKNLQRFFLRVGDQELKQLDKNQLPIEGSLNYSLKREPS
ncbi:copper resistance protein NlpE [Chitinophaga nivalis]|uniref:Copper resistance protein NlpE n=1 Tax=Chitinophaga nivalis TaxID=2991709 RepID=A0ABT3IUV8_9BACT|nr:copper resistance protein NlpE [Chitinophaga nivalis]MCW3462522.1 copper resistance protein NlpE [Chitinophaga nivalis]MCW3487787.1 copper resistance protein NlpE [Chitinophaga nivalis]